MRTIKFRGKGVLRGQWAYGLLAMLDETSWGLLGKIYSHEDEEITTIIDGNTIGQFTGLFDINGKEIYEGDILALAGVETERLEVRFVRGVFAFLWGGNLEEEAPIDQPTHCCVEVIGNIHDNPELLKGGDQ